MAHQITAHGVTYSGIGDAHLRLTTLRRENEAYGESDGRVTEINAIEAAIAEAVTPAEDVWEVVPDEFESPCEHPYCELLHRRFYEGTENFDGYYETPNGGQTYLRVRGAHMKTNHQWVILRNGQRVGSAHDTKREALREAAQRPTI